MKRNAYTCGYLLEKDDHATVYFFESLEKMSEQIKIRRDEPDEIVEFFKAKHVSGILKFSEQYLDIYKGITTIYKFDGITMVNTMLDVV